MGNLKIVCTDRSSYEILARIARSKYASYGLDPSQITFDANGYAVLSKQADQDSWEFCLQEAMQGDFKNCGT